MPSDRQAFSLKIPYIEPEDFGQVAAGFRSMERWVSVLVDDYMTRVGQQGTWTPSWTVTAGTAPAIGNGTLTGRYALVHDLMFWSVDLTAGSTTTFGSGGAWLFSGLPYTPTGPLLGMGMMDCNDNSTGSNFFGRVYLAATTIVPHFADGATGGTVGFVTSTSPMTWATSDFCTMSGWSYIGS